MSGLIACTGEFLPIPGQIISLVIVLVNKGIPGIEDACVSIGEVLISAVNAIAGVGK